MLRTTVDASLCFSYLVAHFKSNKLLIVVFPLALAHTRMSERKSPPQVLSISGTKDSTKIYVLNLLSCLLVKEFVVCIVYHLCNKEITMLSKDNQRLFVLLQGHRNQGYGVLI